MRSLLKENGAEALIGLLVVLIAVWFGWNAWARTGGGRASGAIEVTAVFPSASGVNIGTDVRVAGLKIGQVSAMRLDPKTFEAEVKLALNPAVKLPNDSSAAITSEGILGGSFIAMMPGGDPASLKNGDIIINTQGSTDLMSLVGQFINKSGGSGGNGPSNPPGDKGSGNSAAPAPAP